MFAYTQDNGVVAVCSTQRGVPEGTPFEEVDVTTFPEDRSYREAWVLDGSSVIEDPDKKQGIFEEREAEWAKEQYIALRDTVEALDDNVVTIPGTEQAWKNYRKDLRKYLEKPKGDRPTPPQ